MPVTVLSRHHLRGIAAAAVRRDAKALLAALDEQDADLSISLVDDDEMHILNRDHRGKDKPTDVLAFAMREGTRVAGDEAQLGDIVISLDTAQRQARERGHPTAVEVRTLLVHGVLHLLGYDHERSAAEARRMKSMERRMALVLESNSLPARAGRPRRSPSRGPRP